MRQEHLLETLLNDEHIRQLLDSANDAYWTDPLIGRREFDESDLTMLCRLFLLYANNGLLGKDENSQRHLEEAYKFFRNYPIEREDAKDIFESVIGYNFADKGLLYYFYMASLSLKLDKTISARLLLKAYNVKFDSSEEDWGKRTLTSVLKSLVLLIRKSNGFLDIQLALEIIEQLKSEQKDFEDNYIGSINLSRQRQVAMSLLGIYHVSKALTETALYLKAGYNHNQRRITSTIRQHIDIALSLQDKNSRITDFILLIGANLQLLIKNSIWTDTNFQDKIKQLCQFKANSGVLELLPSQRRALQGNMLDVAANSVVLQMPTSAGKTLMAEFNILVTKSLRSDSRIVYVVPSRALMNQVFYDLREDLSPLGIVVEKTSAAVEVDPAENDFLISDTIDVLVTTPEKLDLLIRRQHPSVDDISLFIVDEAHTIENGIRGARLELLMTMLRRERPDAKYMLLSPFLPGNRDALTEWLGGGKDIHIDWKPSEKIVFGIKTTTKKVKYELLDTPYSLMDLTNHVYENRLDFTLASSSDKDRILEYIIKKYGEEHRTQLILCYGRNTANTQAKKIYDMLPDMPVIPEDVILVQKYMNEEIGCETLYTQLLNKGVAVHHAGLSDESKLLIEHLIRNGYIRYVCATTTIAEGVNFPVSSVYFDDYRRGSDGYLSSNDFWNIAGRAGRTMVDDFGKIILPFHTKTARDRGIGIIKKSAEELSSVLAQLFFDREQVSNILASNNPDTALAREYSDAFMPLFQYFIHLLNLSHNEYVIEVEDILKDTLAYNLLGSDADRAEFIELCKRIYLSIQSKYDDRHGLLKYADKTGFSVPSVLRIMHEKSGNESIADVDSWEPSKLFDGSQPENLAEKIKVIAELKETELGTDSNQSPFNSLIASKILIAWVKGEKLSTISNVHPYFANKDDETSRVSDFVRYINDVRFKASWGLSALEGIVKGNEDDMKDSFVPSFVYYGVNNQKALALRMLGLPRSISNSLSQIISGDLKEYTFTDLRNRVKNLSPMEWEVYRPESSTLSGKELKRIVDILVK